MRICVVLFVATTGMAGTLRQVCSSGCAYTSVQTAVNAAVYGDVIELKAGETFPGNISLPAKNGTGWITIRSSAMDRLPRDGHRISPADAPNMPRILVSVNTTTGFLAATGSHHYRLVGLEVAKASGANYIYSLIAIGDGSQTTEAEAPAHFEIDRCYIHGIYGEDWPRRGILVNGRDITVKNSWVSDCHQIGSDAQAISAWNEPGPIYVLNNHLEASTENILMGGASASIQGIVPGDMQFLGNHLLKPLKYRQRSGSSLPAGSCYDQEIFIQRPDGVSCTPEYNPTLAGCTWYRCNADVWTLENGTGAYFPHFDVKNIFELKNAVRVLVEGNLFENSWKDGQVGTAILFNQVDNGNLAGSFHMRIQDVIYRNNKLLRSANGFQTGEEGTYFTHHFERLQFVNNIWDQLNAFLDHTFILDFGNTVRGALVDHNTAYVAGEPRWTRTTDVGEGSSRLTGFTYTNNILHHSDYGILAQGYLLNAAVQAYVTGYRITNNVFVHPVDKTQAGYLPCCPGNYFNAQTFANVGFADLNKADYSLTGSSPYKGLATDGKDIGADITEVEQATATAITGDSNPYFDFRVRDVDAGTSAAVIRYTAPDSSVCSLRVSTAKSMVPLIDDVNPAREAGADQDNRAGNPAAGKRRSFVVGAHVPLTAATLYYYRLNCGAYRREGRFQTDAGRAGQGGARIELHPPADAATATVEYGATAALGQSVAAGCAGGCAVKIPAPAGAAVYYRQRYDGGTPGPLQVTISR